VLYQHPPGFLGSQVEHWPLPYPGSPCNGVRERGSTHSFGMTLPWDQFQNVKSCMGTDWVSPGWVTCKYNRPLSRNKCWGITNMHVVNLFFCSCFMTSVSFQSEAGPATYTGEIPLSCREHWMVPSLASWIILYYSCNPQDLVGKRDLMTMLWLPIHGL
jgi:hypothetical protein